MSFYSFSSVANATLVPAPPPSLSLFLSLSLSSKDCAAYCCVRAAFLLIPVLLPLLLPLLLAVCFHGLYICKQHLLTAVQEDLPVRSW